MPALRDALAATDVRHQLTVYPGVDHAFHNDTGDALQRGAGHGRLERHAGLVR